MSRGYITVWKEVEVDVELDDFEDDDLIDELEERGHVIRENIDVFKLYQSFITENNDRFREYVKWLLIDNGYHP